MINPLKYIVAFVLILCSTLAFGQEEMILVGQVLDKSDKQPLSNASVYFENSENGTATNQEGYFVLRSKTPQTRLVVSMIGYKTRIIKLSPGKSRGIDIELSEEAKVLPDLIVVPAANPAIQFMQKVRAARKKNNPAYFIGYQTTVEEKTTAAISHIKRKSLNNRLFKGLLKNILTTEDSSLLLPVYLGEETYRLQDGQKISIHNQDKSLILSESNAIKELANKLPIEVNFYENYVSIFGKNFLSPLAGTSGSAYNYFIKDSIKTASNKEYLIIFNPKDNKSLAFEGNMNIDSASLSLTNITANLSSNANINFIKKLTFSQELTPFDQHWVFKNQRTIINLQLIKNNNNTSTSFFVTKNSTYNTTLTDKAIINTGKTTIIPNENEQKFSSSMDSLSHTKLIQNINALSEIIINKYVHIGYLDWGPINLLSSYNRLEGYRFTLGGRTGKKLSTNFTIGGYAGWATKDLEWKYGGEIQYRSKKADYALIGLKYNNDMYQTDFNYHDQIQYENYIGNGLGDVSTLIFPQTGINYNRRKNAEIFFDKQWVKDFNTHFSLSSCQFLPNQYVPYEKNGLVIPSLQDYGFTLDFRFSSKERIMDEFFHRIYLSNYNPVTHIVVEGGSYKTSSSSDYYLKFHTATNQSFLLGNFGKFHYNVEAGFMLGQAPFPMLEIYDQFENNGIDKDAVHPASLNQFVADSYVSLQSDLVTNGILLNHIPLIDVLNLREIVEMKFAYGNLQNKNLAVMELPSFIKPLDTPYMQFDAGIANIFKVLAVESIWEFPQIKNPNNLNWGLQVKLYVDF